VERVVALSAVPTRGTLSNGHRPANCIHPSTHSQPCTTYPKSTLIHPQNQPTLTHLHGRQGRQQGAWRPHKVTSIQRSVKGMASSLRDSGIRFDELDAKEIHLPVTESHLPSSQGLVFIYTHNTVLLIYNKKCYSGSGSLPWQNSISPSRQASWEVKLSLKCWVSDLEGETEFLRGLDACVLPGLSSPTGSR
jgi:hypothetical protein